MSKELVISSNPHETRVAIVEDDQVVEVYHQRENEYSLAGSIHKGKVTRVLPGMQSAFVDIGLERDAFLYVSDFFEDNEEYDKIVTSVEEKVLKLDRPQAYGPAGPGPVPPPPAAALPPSVEPPETAAADGPAAEEQRLPAAESQAPISAAGPLPGGNPDPRRGDDRDRRGRRSRRRRGPKGGGGGRGLPDSKFYSPGPRGMSENLPPEPRPAAEPPAAEGPDPALPDDFFVLPGESLAKYTGGAGPEPHEESYVEELPPLPEEDPEELAEEVALVEAAVDEVVAEAFAEEAPALSVEEEALEEPVSVLASELPAEPLPELAVAVEAVIEEVATEIASETAPPETDAEAVMADSSPADAESPDMEPAGEAEPEPIVEDEGPEPARIPTSLTATLREQGPRYLHRVSRRMRRRGRDGRGGPMEDRPQRGQPSDQRMGDAPPRGGAPEQRTGPVPQSVSASRPEKGAPSISDLLKEGQEIIVQIAKEPLGQKGARITSHIALPGRFLVYMPTVDHIGVSRKIPSDEERSRLKRVLQSNRTGIPGGYIVRTAGDGRTEEELRADMMFLYNLWLDMRQKAERRPAPLLIHHDLNVVERVLRDQLTSSFKSIWVDNEEAYESVLRFVQRFQPALVNRVKLYTRTNPIFDEFNITAELEKALRPKVWLKSGGYIVINQTEALVAIDVNTGKFVGKSNRLEDTIVKTNTDAIKEIVRQIRLRDLGGIIVVDFIDMDERKNRQKVMQALEETMRSDRAPYKILQFNDFGLVAITRKRVKQSLERTLCTPCPYCEGAGYVKSPQTVVGEILQEAHKIAKVVEGKDVLLRVAPDVARVLKSNQNSYLQELEEILGRTVIVKSDNQLHQEKFDLA